MLTFGLNHMTVPGVSSDALASLASTLGCAGVEYRNDLGRAFFESNSPAHAAEVARRNGQRILALAEVKAFNDPRGDGERQARRLVKLAQDCGAEGVALIPKMDAAPTPRRLQTQALKGALERLLEVFEGSGICGLIEPLGFANSTLRFKGDVAEVLHAMGSPECFGLIHDTFHHHLAETDSLHPELTRLVHISGVDDPEPRLGALTDADRVLIGADDRLANVAQLRALHEHGYCGVASFEAFSPKIHDLSDPVPALAGSIEFLSSQIAGLPA